LCHFCKRILRETRNQGGVRPGPRFIAVTFKSFRGILKTRKINAKMGDSEAGEDQGEVVVLKGKVLPVIDDVPSWPKTKEGHPMGLKVGNYLNGNPMHGEVRNNQENRRRLGGEPIGSSCGSPHVSGQAGSNKKREAERDGSNNMHVTALGWELVPPSGGG